MSTIQCDACNELRNYAPNFVHNGTNEEVCASLMNNTGLNPGLTVLHDNCEDLHDVNDCLIGRMTDELDAYDVCDWQDFMKKHNSNLYETLKAMICNECGLWISLCESLDNILAIIRGDSIKMHRLTWTANGRAKFHANPPFDDARFFLTMDAEIRGGIGCHNNRALGMARAGIAHTGASEFYPDVFTYSVQNLVIGDELGYIRKSDVVPTDMTEDFWTNHVIRGGLGGQFALIHNDTYLHVHFRGYAVINGIEINPDLKSYGSDVAVLEVTGLVGGSNSGRVIGGWTDIRSYDA